MAGSTVGGVKTAGAPGGVGAGGGGSAALAACVMARVAVVIAMPTPTARQTRASRVIRGSTPRRLEQGAFTQRAWASGAVGKYSRSLPGCTSTALDGLLGAVNGVWLVRTLDMA